ncbi:MAG: ubiquinol cytochrome C oxidoreductase [Bacteroidota bacterium]|nr:ubiquinol cytochrome C oxidoreductase [Bacteroidota bacterium]
MLLFYIVYAILLLILAPFLTAGKGIGGFTLFFLASMAMPVVLPILWAWLWSTGNIANNIRITIGVHLFAACIALIWLLTAA